MRHPDCPDTDIVSPARVCRATMIVCSLPNPSSVAYGEVNTRVISVMAYSCCMMRPFHRTGTGQSPTAFPMPIDTTTACCCDSIVSKICLATVASVLPQCAFFTRPPASRRPMSSLLSCGRERCGGVSQRVVSCGTAGHLMALQAGRRSLP